VNDKFTLIAATTGGLMLSIALSGILKGTPIISSEKSHIKYHSVANVQVINNKNN
jgi:hypothetical protein